MQATLQLNSTALASLVGNSDYVETICELEFSAPDFKKTTQTLPLRIDNDIIKNTEGAPSPASPEYVTKSYVDSTVKQTVDDSMEEKLSAMQGLADIAEDAARQSTASSQLASEAAQQVSSQFNIITDLARQVEENKIATDVTKIVAEEALLQLEKATPVITNALEAVTAASESAVTAVSQIQTLSDDAVKSAQDAALSKRIAQEAIQIVNTDKNTSAEILKEIITHKEETILNAESAELSKNAACDSAQKAKSSEESAWEAARQAEITIGAEGLFNEMDLKVSHHNASPSAHAELFSQKVDIDYAESSYATKDEVSLKLDQSAAFATYATITEMEKKLDSETAASLYHTQKDAALKLDSIEAATLYATKEEADTKLGIAEATSTYATKSELSTKLASYITTASAQEQFLLSAPPGSVMHYAAATPPKGWLECNGASLSRTTYAALYAAIKTTFGSNSSTTFSLPDLRAYYICGWTNSTSRDPGRTFGSYQADAVQPFDVRFSAAGSVAWKYTSGYENGAFILGAGTAYPPTPHSSASAIAGTNARITNITTNRTASKTRPENVALLPIIKY